MNPLNVTIKDVLNRDTFTHARIIAGDNGINQQIKWTHILETEAFDSLINGGELILTTGQGLELGPSASSTYKRLINKKAACICIEKGNYFKGISPEIKRLADHHGFPIIIFEKIVRFVDITQDLHTLMIHRHYQKLQDLSELTNKFTAHSLSPNGILKILQEVHNYLKTNTVFITEEDKCYYYPPESKKIKNDLQSCISSRMSEFKIKQSFIKLNNEWVAVSPVIGMGQVWGYLCLEMERKDLVDEFSLSVLDRAALALAQILLRNKTLEERKLNLEDELVQQLLQGSKYEGDIHSVLPVQSTNLYFRMILLESTLKTSIVGEKEWEEIKIHQTITIRTLLKQHGFFPIISVRRNNIAVICGYISSEDRYKKREEFSSLIKALYGINDITKINGRPYKIGVSRSFKDIAYAQKGYLEAMKVLTLQEKEIVDTPFYEEIGVHQFLSHYLEKEEKKLLTFIDDYLNPLFDLEKSGDTELLNTLEVYLGCLGSKKETAKKLFIVRQTLYHRLDKLKRLLGDDFMEPRKRLAIEVAIKAYNLVNTKSHSNH